MYYETLFEGFEEKPMHELLLDITNGLYKPEADYGEGVPIVRIDDFSNGSLIDENSPPLKRVAAIDKEIDKYRISQGEILLNRVNSLEHVGKVALVGKLSEPVLFESNMMRLRFNEDLILPEYARNVLTIPSVVEQIRAKSKRAIGQVSVNQGDIKSIFVPLPPLTEQKRILEALHSRLAVIDGLHKAIKDTAEAINLQLNDIWSID